MRLEKGHFIVGQDTDGLTKAPTTGLTSPHIRNVPDELHRQLKTCAKRIM